MVRILRFILCLIMVFSILVNCSPIRAEAVAATTFALVSGLTVLGSCLIGLGLAAGDNQEAFYEVCTMIAQHPKILPYFDADGNIKIPRFGLEDGELSPWLVPAVFLQAIRGAISDLQILNFSGDSLNGVPDDKYDTDLYYGNYLLPRFDVRASSPYYIILREGSRFWAYDLTTPLVMQNGSLYVGSDPCTRLYYYCANGSWFDQYGETLFSPGELCIDLTTWNYSIVYANFSISDVNGNLVYSPSDPTEFLVTTDYDLTLFDVAPLDQELAQGYPDWALGQIQDDDENYWYPLGLNQTLDQTLGLTQEQVQKGEGNFDQTQDQEQTQIPGLIQGFQDKVSTWFARMSLNQVNILDYLKSIFGQEQKQEHTQAQTQGNQSVDQIIQIIPDDSQDYLAAFGSLVSVVSYEGTAAVITMPALTVPGLPGLFAEKTYLEEQQVDLEAYVNMLPDVLLVLIRALFDAALVLFCLKEFFSTVGNAVSNYVNTEEVSYE